MSAGKNFGCGCLAAVAALAGFVILIFALCLGYLGGRASADADDLLGEASGEYGSDRPECDRPLDKKWMCGTGGADDPEIVYIPMQGVIAGAAMGEETLFGPVSDYSRALKSIRTATRDRKIRGICLMLETPGGTVTDSDIMAYELRRFKAADTNRFVIAMMGSMCCSGGYYVAAGADCIMANPTTLTGSIGVIMHGFNAAELAKKIGVKSVVIASGTNKALLDPMEPVNPEHVKIMKRAVEHDYERFVSIVAKGRKLPVDKVREIADGRILSAGDAKEAKLIDELGYADDVWRKAAELAKAKKVRIYRYEEPFSWKSLFSSSTFMKCGQSFIKGMMSEAENTAPHNEYRVR